jgi:flavin-dependent dehydrogenase
MSGFQYDVVILGSGMGGSLLAMLCRSIGLRVLLVEKHDHPRFAIGESVGGEVLRRLDYLARRYQLPLLRNLSSYSRIKRAGLPIATWPKVHAYFVRHELGQRFDPAAPEEIMAQASTWPLGPDAHLYRPDSDLLLKDEAVRAGADYLPHTETLAFDFDENTGGTVTLQPAGAEPRSVTCRLLVDATGPARWLSRHLGIDEVDNAKVPMASGTIFTHFRTTKSWEESCGGRRRLFPRDHGTLLHVGSLGQFWVIPFDNGITSVGWVTPDPLPAEGTPEELFQAAMAQYPSLAEQFRDAEAVTDYRRIDRLQYSTAQVSGDGWFLLPASAEFSDPLFSVGIPLMLVSITRLIHRLERMDRDRPVLRSDLDGLEERFRLESEYIRKYTIATKRCFHDFELLHRAINLYRLVIFREGGYIDDSDSEAADMAAFGVDDPTVRNIIDSFYNAVLAIDFSRPVTATDRDNFERAIRAADVDGFLDSAWGRLRPDAVYINSIPLMLDYFWKARHGPLGLGKMGGFRRISRRWLGGFVDALPIGTRTSDEGRTPRPVAPGVIRDQLRVMLRV